MDGLKKVMSPEQFDRLASGYERYSVRSGEQTQDDKGMLVELNDALARETVLQEQLELHAEFIKTERETYQSELDELRRKLAALREELANLGTYNYQLNAQYERMCESHLAAEQRNSELSALLSRAQEFAAFVHKCVGKNGEYAPLHWQEMVEIDRDLSAALKPTESGASE